MGSGAHVLVGQTTGVASMRRHRPLQIVSVGSKTDTILGQIESISHAVGASAKTCLRSTNISAQMYERRLRICKSNNSADTKTSEEGVGRGTPGSEAEMW